MEKYWKGFGIIGGLCLCVMLSACGSHAVSDRSESASSGVEQSMPEEAEDIWGGYAQEHADLIRKYPKWFDGQGEIVYPYPKPGEQRTAEGIPWRKNDIPKEIIDSLSTRQLLRVTAEFPDLMEILDSGYVPDDRYGESLYLELQAGIQNSAEYTDVCVELMERKDLIPTCYEFYRDARLEDSLLEKYDPEEESYYGEGHMAVMKARCEILLAEYVLCTEEVYEQLSEEEREAVVASAKRIQCSIKKALKKLGGYMFPFYCLDAYHFSALARSAKRTKLSPWQDLLIEKGVDIYAYPKEKILTETWIQ